MFRGRGFCCLASPPFLPEAFNSTFPPGAATGVPQLGRFRGLATQWRNRVLLCRDAFAAYCGTAFAAVLHYCGADSTLEPLSAGYVDSADDKIVRNGVQAGSVSRIGSNSCSSLTSPLLRIGAPSPYVALSGDSLSMTLRCYPTSVLPWHSTAYQPQHAPDALVAIGTSLASAEITRPQTQKSTPEPKEPENPTICRTFTSSKDSPHRTLQPTRLASRRLRSPDYARLQQKKQHTRAKHTQPPTPQT